MDNAIIESFNGSFQDECLNVNWLLSIDDAREKIEMWREDYNDFRPHSALENLTPRQFAEQLIRAAVDPDVKGGEYYGPDGFREMRGFPVLVQSNAASHSEADAKRLWEVSERLTGVSFL
jgi:hypothetical protein